MPPLQFGNELASDYPRLPPPFSPSPRPYNDDMKAGDLVSYSRQMGTRTNTVEGHGTICCVSGDRVTIKTSDGKIEVHRGSCQPEPTATEIAAACEIIQRTWSAVERDRRRRHYATDQNRASPLIDAPHYTVPTIRMRELLESLAS